MRRVLPRPMCQEYFHVPVKTEGIAYQSPRQGGGVDQRTTDLTRPRQTILPHPSGRLGGKVQHQLVTLPRRLHEQMQTLFKLKWWIAPPDPFITISLFVLDRAALQSVQSVRSGTHHPHITPYCQVLDVLGLLLRWAVERYDYGVVALVGLQGHLLLRLEVFGLELRNLLSKHCLWRGSGIDA